jgi:Vitamin B12 dependent methionine synthase, activation domain
VLATFHGLRQQAEKDNKEPYCCLSDFIAPKVCPWGLSPALCLAIFVPITLAWCDSTIW